MIRQVVEHAGLEGLAIASFSTRTVVYKGMLSAPQLPRYYPDLRDERLKSALALVHSRFSTNTFPSWELAHPYRMLAHNGEINTLRGNRNWMRAREMQLASPLFGDDIEKLLPLLSDDISDSASLDRVMELLVMGGRSPAHAISMMIPEAYSGRPELHQRVRDFYAYHSSLIEPWDGPAAVAFSDGRVVGATLDRNGLRPGRWLVTRDGWVALASETGVLDVDAEDVRAKGRLRPGKVFLVDLEKGAVLSDAAVKRELAERRPYGQWLTTAWSTSRTSRPRPRACREWSPCGPSSSPSGGARRTCACCWRRWPAPPPSPPPRWATTPRWRCCRTAGRRCSPTSSSCSRRSPTRPSTRSASPW